MDIFAFIDRLLKPVLRRIAMNRWNYTEAEYEQAAGLGFFEVLDFKAMGCWIKADPICSSHCSGCHNEGRPLYFNALGLLIRHKCPPYICIHGLSQLSPVIYSYYDHMLRGKDPNETLFKYITCTDAGLDAGGLGDNLFRITYEKMPLWEFARFFLTMSFYLVFTNKKARGDGFMVRNAPRTRGPEPTDFMRGLPLADSELKDFMTSPERVKRLSSMERFQGYRIIIRVVSASACLAGHREGDEFVVDARGVLQPLADGNGICMMALHKIWGRVMLMLERLAEADGNADDFTGKIFDLPMNCYGAGLPLGSCGEIMMVVEVRAPADIETGSN